jgi:cell division transport system permease protein
MTISLYLDDKYDKNTVEVFELLEAIKKIEGNIKANYKTKEDILDEIRLKEPDLAKILERTNPLPDTIVLSDIELEQYEELNKIIENKLYILSKDESDRQHFSNYTTQYKKIEQVTGILNILQLWLYVVIIIFLISISVIIYSVIWNFVYYYKDEIYITRLVWGSKVFIYWPFVLQWAIYSFLSFLLSLIIFIFIIQNINSTFSDLYFLNISYNILFSELLTFIFIGWISGFFSSRRYLK